MLVTCVAISLGPHSIGDYFTETDFYGSYAEGAAAIQQGHLLPSRYHVIGPGYELMLALAALPGRDFFLSAQLLSAVSAALTLVLWFIVLRSRLGPVTAAAATLLYAANPTFLRYGYSATTDAFAVALQMLALTLLLVRRGDAWMFAAGFVAAAAFLTRYTAVHLLPIGAIAIAADAMFRGRRRRALLLYVAGFAFPALAWTIFVWSSGERPASQHHHLIAFEAFARARGITWDAYERDLEPRLHSLLDVLRYDPRALIATWLRNLFEHAWLDARQLLGWGVAVFAGAGLILGIADRSLRRAWPLALTGLVAYLALVPVRHSERYSLMILPVYGMLAGMVFGSRLLAARRGRFALAPLLVVVPLALSIVASVRLQADVLAKLPREAEACAEVLRASRRPGDGVIARKPHVAYIAGVRSIPFPHSTTLPELAAYARQTGARWLYFSYPEAESRPDYYPLIDTTGAVAGLVPRCVGTQAPAVLYEIGPEFGPATTWVTDPRLMNLRVARARLLIYPDDVQAMWLEAAMELLGGDWNRSARTLKQAARIDPRSREPLAEIADRDSTRAAASLERLLSTLRPNAPAAPPDEAPLP